MATEQATIRRYYQENRERHAENSRRWHEANRERVAENSRRWHSKSNTA